MGNRDSQARQVPPDASFHRVADVAPGIPCPERNPVRSYGERPDIGHQIWHLAGLLTFK